MATEHPLFIATFRAVFRATDDVEAILIADKIKENGERDLEPEDGDTFDVTQVTQNAAMLSPEQTVMLLRRARNALIRTRIQHMVECARQIDQCIHMLDEKTAHETGAELARYDYGQFVDICEEVLGGGNPVHI